MSTETVEAPRDDLIRGVTEVRAEGDGNTMVGYPIVFDTWTMIDSWEGRFRERIHPGALRKTLKERGDQVKVQFDHGMHPVIGSLPLGRVDTMRTDDLGLWVEVSLSHAKDVQELIKPRISEGSIDGMSFRFSVVREQWDDSADDGVPERTITELRLFELGPVTWPAYQATQVGIRGQAAFAAWMQQSPEERAQLMGQFGLEQRREIIRVRSGAVEVDTPDPHDTEARAEAADTTDSDDAPDEGGSSTRDAPTDDGHPSQHENDAPADPSHPSSSDEPTADVPARAKRPPLDRDHMRLVAASIRERTAAVRGIDKENDRG